MNVRGLAVAMFCAAVPFTLSCAQSDEFDTAGSATPAQSSTGGAATVGVGGLGGGVNATGGHSGGFAGNPMVTGGSAGQPETGRPVAGHRRRGPRRPAAAAHPARPRPAAARRPRAGGRQSRLDDRRHHGQPGGRPAARRQSGAPAAARRNRAAARAAPAAAPAPSAARRARPGGSTGATGGTPGATGGTTGATGGSGPARRAGGTIVPLYTDPTDRSWTAIVTAALAHPTVEVVAIVNPADGPGPSKSADYTTGIATLQAAHIKVIGYVATGYGSHSIASMEAEIDSWKSFYPTVQGIFFDEQSNDPADVAHYQTLSQYAKSKGLAYTVGNPGTDVPDAYIGALDTMMVYESDGLPSIASLKAWSAYAPSNFGIIPYKCSMDAAFVKQARQYIRYIYLQSDDLPEPVGLADDVLQRPLGRAGIAEAVGARRPARRARGVPAGPACRAWRGIRFLRSARLA